MFITIEGIEGVGKSTHSQFIADYLRQAGVDLCVTREPGGTIIGEAVRTILLAEHPEPMSADAELLLVFAARAQHIEQIIKPALAAGQWVFSDRFTDATYAYQGGGRKMEDLRIAVIEQWVQGDLRPDVTLLLDAPPELGLARARQRGVPDRFEREQVEFFDAVRAKYLARAEQSPEHYRIIDASQSLDAVQADIQQELRTLL